MHSLVDHICKNSLPMVFYKKDILKSFAKFTRKHLCRRFFFNKVAGLMSATLFRKKLWHRCLPVNFAKLLITPIFKNICERLLINLLLHTMNSIDVW